MKTSRAEDEEEPTMMMMTSRAEDERAQDAEEEEKRTMKEADTDTEADERKQTQEVEASEAFLDRNELEITSSVAAVALQPSLSCVRDPNEASVASERCGPTWFPSVQQPQPSLLRGACDTGTRTGPRPNDATGSRPWPG